MQDTPLSPVTSTFRQEFQAIPSRDSTSTPPINGHRVSESVSDCAILRREGYPKPYEALKALTRTNAHITHESIAAFIETLDVAETVKEELRALAPSTYTGVFR